MLPTTLHSSLLGRNECSPRSRESAREGLRASVPSRSPCRKCCRAVGKPVVQPECDRPENSRRNNRPANGSETCGKTYIALVPKTGTGLFRRFHRVDEIDVDGLVADVGGHVRRYIPVQGRREQLLGCGQIFARGRSSRRLRRGGSSRRCEASRSGCCRGRGIRVRPCDRRSPPSRRGE